MTDPETIRPIDPRRGDPALRDEANRASVNLADDIRLAISEALGHTRTTIAADLGVTESAIAKWCTGASIPTTRHLKDLIRLLALSADRGRSWLRLQDAAKSRSRSAADKLYFDSYVHAEAIVEEDHDGTWPVTPTIVSVLLSRAVYRARTATLMVRWSIWNPANSAPTPRFFPHVRQARPGDEDFVENYPLPELHGGPGAWSLVVVASYLQAPRDTLSAYRSLPKADRDKLKTRKVIVAKDVARLVKAAK